MGSSLDQILRPILTNIVNFDHYYQQKNREHRHHIISAQKSYYIPLIIIIFLFILFQPHRFRYIVELAWASIVLFIAVPWYIKRPKSVIVLAATFVALLCPVLYSDDSHELIVAFGIQVISTLYWLFYSRVVIPIFGKIKGVSIHDYILCLVSKHATLSANQGMRKYGIRVQRDLHAKYDGPLSQYYDLSYHLTRNTKVVHALQYIEDYKGDIALKEEEQKEITRLLMADNHRRIMKKAIAILQKMKADSELKDLIYILCPGSCVLYTEYGFAKSVWQKAKCYGRASDVDIKMYCYENFTDAQLVRFMKYLAELIVFVRDNAPPTLTTAKGTYQLCRAGKRSFSATFFDDHSKEIQYNYFKSFVQFYSDYNMHFGVEQEINDVDETKQMAKVFNLFRLKVVYEHIDTGEKYSAEVLDISMDLKSDAKYMSPLQLAQEIESNYITIDGVNFPKWEQFKADNHRLITEGRSEQRKDKCRQREKVHDDMDFLYGERIRTFNNDHPAHLTESERNYLYRMQLKYFF